MQHHIRKEAPSRGACGTPPFRLLGSEDRLMGDIQPHQREICSAGKHLRGGLRILGDIGFRPWGHIARYRIGATHGHHPYHAG